MTNTPPPRRLAALAAGFGVALAVPMIGLSSTLPSSTSPVRRADEQGPRG